MIQKQRLTRNGIISMIKNGLVEGFEAIEPRHHPVVDEIAEDYGPVDIVYSNGDFSMLMALVCQRIIREENSVSVS